MHSYLPLEWIHSNLEWIHSNREWIHSKSLDVFLEKCSGPAQNNIIWKILFGMDSTKIFRVLATTFSSQFSKKWFNPSMNSFQYGMNVFQVRMNSFHMGMYSYYYRYSHTVISKTVLKCCLKLHLKCTLKENLILLHLFYSIFFLCKIFRSLFLFLSN